MRVKKSKLESITLKRKWIDIALKAARNMAKQSEADLAQLLRPTLESPAFEGATIETDSTVTRNGNKIQMHVWATVSGSLIWEFQQFGTRARVQKNTSPPIEERDKPKVIKRRLRLDKSQGRTGRTFVIPAGKRVRGVEAAEWYQAAGAEQRRHINNTARRYRVVAVSVQEHYGA